MDAKITDFIYRLGEFQIKLGLKTTAKLMNLLHNPHLHPRIIHIAGTNGKGSSIRLLEKLLLESNFKVAATTSPHLLHYRERFRFQGMPITEKELEQIFWKLCEKCGINPDLPPQKWKIQPTFFEFSIGLAFFWFKEKNPDFILLETGMGGKLDATNIIPESLVSGLSSISFDHTEFLGNTLEKIAQEKFGIIKPNSLIVSAQQLPNIQKILKEKFPQHKKFLGGEDFYFKKDKDKISFYGKAAGKDILFSWKSIKLIGDYQYENAALALQIYLQIIPLKNWISAKKIAVCLEETKWLARLQYLKKTTPYFLLEAAHNESGIKLLGQYLKKNYFKKKILCLIHWMKKKKILLELSKWNLANIDFLPLDFKHLKANNAKDIYQKLKSIHLNSLYPISTQQFIKNYLKGEFLCYDLILCTGSIYFLGDFCSNLIENSNLYNINDFYGL